MPQPDSQRPDARELLTAMVADWRKQASVIHDGVEKMAMLDCAEILMEAVNDYLPAAPAVAPASAVGDAEWLLKAGDVLAAWCNESGDALRGMMDAYERRIRTDCTPEQIEKKPWECREYLIAKTALDNKPVWVIDIPHHAAPPASAAGDLQEKLDRALENGRTMSAAADRHFQTALKNHRECERLQERITELEAALAAPSDAQPKCKVCGGTGGATDADELCCEACDGTGFKKADAQPAQAVTEIMRAALVELSNMGVTGCHASGRFHGKYPWQSTAILAIEAYERARSAQEGETK